MTKRFHYILFWAYRVVPSMRLQFIKLKIIQRRHLIILHTCIHLSVINDYRLFATLQSLLRTDTQQWGIYNCIFATCARRRKTNMYVQYVMTFYTVVVTYMSIYWCMSIYMYVCMSLWIYACKHMGGLLSFYFAAYCLIYYFTFFYAHMNFVV